MGCSNVFFLLADLILKLQELYCFVTLIHVGDYVSTNIYHQGWQTTQVLGLEGDHEMLWYGYLIELNIAHTRLREDLDALVWEKYRTIGSYTTKLEV